MELKFTTYQTVRIVRCFMPRLVLYLMYVLVTLPTLRSDSRVAIWVFTFFYYILPRDIPQ